MAYIDFSVLDPQLRAAGFMPPQDQPQNPAETEAHELYKRLEKQFGEAAKAAKNAGKPLVIMAVDGTRDSGTLIGLAFLLKIAKDNGINTIAADPWDSLPIPPEFAADTFARSSMQPMHYSDFLKMANTLGFSVEGSVKPGFEPHEPIANLKNSGIYLGNPIRGFPKILRAAHEKLPELADKHVVFFDLIHPGDRVYNPEQRPPLLFLNGENEPLHGAALSEGLLKEAFPVAQENLRQLSSEKALQLAQKITKTPFADPMVAGQDRQLQGAIDRLASVVEEKITSGVIDKNGPFTTNYQNLKDLLRKGHYFPAGMAVNRALSAVETLSLSDEEKRDITRHLTTISSTITALRGTGTSPAVPNVPQKPAEKKR